MDSSRWVFSHGNGGVKQTIYSLTRVCLRRATAISQVSQYKVPIPDIKVPDIKVPDIKVPDIKVPEVKTPDAP